MSFAGEARHTPIMRTSFIRLAPIVALFALPGCVVGTAVSVAGDVVEGAVNVTGDVAEGAVNTVGAVIPDGDDDEEDGKDTES